VSSVPKCALHAVARLLQIVELLLDAAYRSSVMSYIMVPSLTRAICLVSKFFRTFNQLIRHVILSCCLMPSAWHNAPILSQQSPVLIPSYMARLSWPSCLSMIILTALLFPLACVLMYFSSEHRLCFGNSFVIAIEMHGDDSYAHTIVYQEASSYIIIYSFNTVDICNLYRALF